jgi:hypothetical protein
MNMKKCIVSAVIAVGGLLAVLTGCTEAERARYNLSQEADNFNCSRRITVINGITNDTILQVEGRCSITADREDNQLEIIIEYEQGKYKKNIIGLADNITYLVEDLEPSNVDPYHYEVNWNPKMWSFAEPAYID